jgi:hypothetical protein
MRACVPGAACQSNADCGDDMVCFESTSTQCSGDTPTTKPCPEGVACEKSQPTAPPSCTEVKVKSCIPKYAAPCTNAADCGDGFRCVEQQSCGCSGSAGGEPPPARDATSTGTPRDTAASPPDCSCAPSGVFSCAPIVEHCAEDTQCPADWTCEDHGSTSSGGCADPGPAAGAPADVSFCDAGPPVVTHDNRCTPPFGGLGGSVPTGDLGKSNAEDQSSAVPPTAAGSNPGSSESNGCQMSRVASPLGGAFFAGVLGLLGFALRRARVRRGAST